MISYSSYLPTTPCVPHSYPTTMQTYTSIRIIPRLFYYASRRVGNRNSWLVIDPYESWGGGQPTTIGVDRATWAPPPPAPRFGSSRIHVILKLKTIWCNYLFLETYDCFLNELIPLLKKNIASPTATLLSKTERNTFFLFWGAMGIEEISTRRIFSAESNLFNIIEETDKSKHGSSSSSPPSADSTETTKHTRILRLEYVLEYSEVLFYTYFTFYNCHFSILLVF